MPIEIKELHIKAIVSAEKKQTEYNAVTPEVIAKLKKEIIKEVSEKILKSLQLKNER